MMKWPLSQDFNEAIQNPAASFSDPDLKAGQAVVGIQGLPLPYSGNYADVYQVVGADGRNWAVKCFTRRVFGLEGRYGKVAEALARARLPFGVEFTFLEEGIRVRGEWRPVVKMEWVEGRLLNQVVEDNAGRPAVLATLFQLWVRLCRRLREADIAHADLQHGNVLLVPGSRPGAYGLKLLDYDGMYLPSLAHNPSGEAGHPNYQHPERIATRAYCPDLDRFPHLVVATALKALEALGPGLWGRYDIGENLLFVENDFRAPARSALMNELWQSGMPAVQALVGRLAVACRKPIAETPWLDLIAPDGEPQPLDPDTLRAANELFDVPVLVPVVEAYVVEPAYAGSVAPAYEEVIPEVIPGEEPDPAQQPFEYSPPEPYEPYEAPSGPHSPEPQGWSEPAHDPADDSHGNVVEREVGSPSAPVSWSEPAYRSISDGPRGVIRRRRARRKNSLLMLALGGSLFLSGVGIAVVLLLIAKKPAATVQAGKLDDPSIDLWKGFVQGNSASSVIVPGGKGATVPPGSGTAPIPNLPFRWSVHTRDRVWAKPSGNGAWVLAYLPGRPVQVYAVQSPTRVGEFTDGTNLWEFRPQANGSVVSWAPDRPTAVVWDPATRTALGQLPVGNPPKVTGEMVFDVSPDGRYVVAGSRLLGAEANPAAEGQVRVHDVQARRDVLALQVRVPQFRFTSSGSLLVADVDRCRWFRLSDGLSEGEVALPQATRPVLSAISPDGSQILWGDGDRTVKVLDSRTAKVLAQFSGRAAVPASGFSADGRLAVVVALPELGSPARTSFLEVVDLVAGRPVGHFALGSDRPPDLTTAYVTPDGRHVVAGQLRRSILVLDIPATRP